MARSLVSGVRLLYLLMSLPISFSTLFGSYSFPGKPAKAEVRQPLSSRPTSNNANTNALTRPIAPVPHRSKPSVYAPVDSTIPESEDDISEMDVDRRTDASVTPLPGAGKLDVDSLDGVSEEDEEEEEEDEDDEEDWTRMTEGEALVAQQELATIRSTFKDDVDMFDTTMVAEYADDIFAHMEELELSVMPNPRYMDFQTEIEW